MKPRNVINFERKSKVGSGFPKAASLESIFMLAIEGGFHVSVEAMRYDDDSGTFFAFVALIENQKDRLFLCPYDINDKKFHPYIDVDVSGDSDQILTSIDDAKRYIAESVGCVGAEWIEVLTNNA